MSYFLCRWCKHLKARPGRCAQCRRTNMEREGNPGVPLPRKGELRGGELRVERKGAQLSTLNSQPLRRRGDEEHRAQVAVVTWATLARAEFPELNLLFAIPNGGHRNVIVAKKLKAEGVRAGVPDLCLPVARGGYHGLFIEMKAGKNRVSEAQVAFHAALQAQSFKVVTCYTSGAAWQLLRDYLGLSSTQGRKDPRGGMDRE